MKKILEKIFSVKNNKNRTHKVITILGIKINIRKKSSELHDMLEYIYIYNNKRQEEILLLLQSISKKIAITEEILLLLQSISKKLAMPEEIWQYKNVKFYVPYYPLDFLQKHIVDNNEFFEEDILKSLDKYIPDDAVILDIGANIGNHTLYWNLASSKHVFKVYCFEPVPDTFKILEKNIKINRLQDKVQLYNVGLNDCEAAAEFKTYKLENIGSTHLVANEQKKDGEMKLCRLDDFKFPENHIDFVKIDVEDMEIPCLKGAINTLKKYKPTIFIESQYENITEVKKILESIGYELLEEYPHKNWLFKIIQNKSVK